VRNHLFNSDSPTPVVAFLPVTSIVTASALATQIFSIPFYFSSNEWHLLLEILTILRSKRWKLGTPSGKQGKIRGSLSSESLSLSPYSSKAKHPSWDLHLSPLPVLVPVWQLQPFYSCQLDLLPLFS
jgi:hypothetical protein